MSGNGAPRRVGEAPLVAAVPGVPATGYQTWVTSTRWGLAAVLPNAGVERVESTNVTTRDPTAYPVVGAGAAGLVEGVAASATAARTRLMTTRRTTVLPPSWSGDRLWA